MMQHKDDKTSDIKATPQNQPPQENNMPTAVNTRATSPAANHVSIVDSNFSHFAQLADTAETVFINTASRPNQQGVLIVKRLAQQSPEAYAKRNDNVIGLFPGLSPMLHDMKPDMSLTVSAAREALTSFEASLAQMGIRLIVSDEALRAISQANIDAKLGAEPIQKTIQMQIEYPLSQAVLKGRFTKGDTIMVLWENGGNTFLK
jgi:C-terminal, D2-small domain, of ClpB protein